MRIVPSDAARLFNGRRVRVRAMARLVHPPPSTPTPRFPFYDFYANPDVPNGEITQLTFHKFLYAMNDSDMEDDHDYVQWVFPTPTKSQQRSGTAQFECTRDEYRCFRRDTIVMRRVEDAIAKMLMFWGISYNRVSGVIGIMEADRERFIRKLVRENHNQSRFTRILTFLRCVHRDALTHSLLYLFSAPWITMRVNDLSWGLWRSALKPPRS
jgi:hypothetical protein